MPEITKFLDDHPERDFANSERLGFILALTGRQVRRLAADRILPKEPDGSFHISRCVDAFVAYRTAPRPAAHEALDQRRTEVLQRRLDREAEELIEMTDALETFDLTTRAFQIAIDMVAQELGEVDDPKKAAWVIADAKAKLADKFSALRLELETGKGVTP